jgi:hypothetical protein
MKNIYDVFLSYSHKDAGIAELLSKRIRRYKIPSKLKTDKHRIDVFRDTERLTACTDLTHELINHLNSSNNLILLVSSSTKASDYVNKEIEAYLTTKKIESIIFVLLEGELFDNLPPILQNQPIEPLFINLVNFTKKKFNQESLRLIAAVLNVDFTQLSMEDLKYRRRRKQVISFSLIGSLILMFCAYLIVSTDIYHWKQINQPKFEQDFMPVHEIAVNKSNPSVLLFHAFEANRASHPFPEGESILPADLYTYDNEVILLDEKIQSFIKNQVQIHPAFSIDFNLPNSHGKGTVNIYAISEDSTACFLRDFQFKGVNSSGAMKNIKTPVTVCSKSQNIFDLYPYIKLLYEEQIVERVETDFEAIIKKHFDGTIKKEVFAWKQNDDGYGELAETWGPSRKIFSNDTTSDILIDSVPVNDITADENELWEKILNSPDWITFQQPSKYKVGDFSAEFDLDTLPFQIQQWNKENIPYIITLPPYDTIVSRVRQGENSEINAIISKFGNNHGVILEVRNSVQKIDVLDINPAAFFFVASNETPWIELKLSEILQKSKLLDLIALDASGKNFMILTTDKGYYRTFDGGKKWEESNYGEMSFQNGKTVKTLVTPSSVVYAFVDKNTEFAEGINPVFRMEKRTWLERLRIGFAEILTD